ncbi:hypothetical protein [Methylobacterium sp. WL6]|uniref:hypothetical protein n=1 Tax=Methylobacterium sp. WL6 TaxID=2603901 RepID=UPI0011CA3939|nr:hypothetical protein [Methylobacterium sp. WL6]TXN56325.1 hypothetical protein FV230_28325 [Methylobacterium sp. WL6]
MARVDGEVRRGTPGSAAEPRTAGPDRLDAIRPSAAVTHSGLHNAVLFLDIETVPDPELVPLDWPAERFPKCAWHRIVAISFVVAELSRVDGVEAYAFSECRSGDEAIPDKARLLAAF